MSLTKASGQLGDFVLSLSDPRSEDTAIAGGKAARLSKLMRAGLPVPAGFVITAGLLDALLERADVSDRIRKRLLECDVMSRTERRRFAFAVERWISALEVPRHIRDQIESAYLGLAGGVAVRVAVRSSGIAEDQRMASSAGQYDTILNVGNLDELWAAIRTCWAALWNERVVQYRMLSSIPSSDARMAVLVQAMVTPSMAGVLFTRDPSSSEPQGMLLESVTGLGESLVSGEQVKDRFRLHTGGDIETLQQTGSSVLDEVQLRSLFHFGEVARQVFKHEQDLEWAIADSGAVVLQSRDVTTADSAEPTGEEEHAPPYPLTRTWLFEWFRQPLTPLFATALLPTMMDAMFSAFEREFRLRIRLPQWALVRGYLYLRFDIWAVILAAARGSLRFLAGLRTGDEMWQHAAQQHREAVRQGSVADVAALDDRELTERITLLVQTNSKYFAQMIVAGAYCKATEAVFRVAYALLPRKPRGRAYHEFLIGLDDSSAKADAAFGNLQRELRQRPDVHKTLLERPLEELESASEPALQAFFEQCRSWLDAYGHRQDDLDLIEPTFVDDPWSFIDMAVASAGTTTDAQRAPSADVTALPWPIRPLGALAKRYAHIREDRPFNLHLGWPPIRRLLLEHGRRLARQGQIEVASDVFFLTLDELTAEDVAAHNAPLSAVVCERKALWLRRRRVTPLEYLNTSFAHTFRAPDRRGSVRKGVAASPGRVQGRVRIVRTPAEFGRLRSGEILVAPATTPAWTVLFTKAAGLVTERGGALSHGAIVSREYGLPAVTGLSGIVDSLCDGDSVTVDGNAGTLIIHRHARVSEQR